LQEVDLAGSGFTITGHTVHGQLDGDAAMARLRRAATARAQAALRAVLCGLTKSHLTGT
jgi:hypothetical protein